MFPVKAARITTSGPGSDASERFLRVCARPEPSSASHRSISTSRKLPYRQRSGGLWLDVYSYAICYSDLEFLNLPLSYDDHQEDPATGQTTLQRDLLFIHHLSAIALQLWPVSCQRIHTYVAYQGKPFCGSMCVGWLHSELVQP